MTWCRDRFRTTLAPKQIAPDGSLPLELARTKPYSYSLFNMDVLCGVAQSLSTEADNLWGFTTSDGRGLRSRVTAFESPQGDECFWPGPAGCRRDTTNVFGEGSIPSRASAGE